MRKDSSITIRLPEAEKEVLKQMAEERDISISQLVREIVRKIFEEGR